MNNNNSDRYISFCNIDCDENANHLMNILHKNLENRSGSEKWNSYFRNKIQEQNNMGRDNLNFIGNQLNMLYSYFDECEDKEALELLYQLEQECC